jgi:hypothetical protein
MSQGVFSILPEHFFSPLAGLNRRHYAALLVLYYRLFQETPRGLERELVIREFMAYLALNRKDLKEEEGADSPGTDAGVNPEETGPGEEEPQGERLWASQFLRRLIDAKWLSEETLKDYTRVINITPWGRPFFEALVRVEEGLKTEYESHVVNVYSSLCGETVQENGHFMVLKAREEARALIDSLKVLSQSIKGYYDDLKDEAVRSEAHAVLHQHYDLYAGAVLDKAYKRLKTSDNVSRYRQAIFQQIGTLLKDEQWLEESAFKYLRILQTSREDCRRKLRGMLEEIRDDLRSVDPLEDEIDRRNADYSRSSIEIIKAYIEPDSTIPGKINLLCKAIYGSGDAQDHDRGSALAEHLAYDLYRITFLSPATLSFPRDRRAGNFRDSRSPAEREIEERALVRQEAEFFDRMKKRLSLGKIIAWLDEQGGRDLLLFPDNLIQDEASYIRFVYALLYGDSSRENFAYQVEEAPPDPQKGGRIHAAGFSVPDLRFRRKRGA